MMKYIRQMCLIGLVMGSLVIGQGCAGCSQTWSHMKSQTVGINREVTLYNNNGAVIRTWKTNIPVEDRGGSFRLIVNGKALTISGTVVIEEI